jgi:16S rRNA (guanine527-N7)-methyltransferase
MDADRITDLLAPFLRAPVQQHSTNVCHSEMPPATNASSERSRREAVVLSPAQLHHISTYIDMLLRWNARVNLTAIRDPEEIVTRHFGESLFAARHLFPSSSSSMPSSVSSVSSVVKSPNSIADVGSGAGFPGLPLKIWAPEISLTLIESNHKKAAFLREVARALTLTDIDIQNTRAETLRLSAFDVVTLRAVERFEAILPAAAGLVIPTGRLALLIGSAQQDQARTSLPQFSWSIPIPVPNSHSRILLIGQSDL